MFINSLLFSDVPLENRFLSQKNLVLNPTSTDFLDFLDACLTAKEHYELNNACETSTIIVLKTFDRLLNNEQVLLNMMMVSDFGDDSITLIYRNDDLFCVIGSSVNMTILKLLKHFKEKFYSDSLLKDALLKFSFIHSLKLDIRSLKDD